ncbi:hypothetical protein FKB36_09790 [Methanoculleus sp. Afa-1]|uniref:Uncharacterized protein n=1 Tax=Methanoculleus formosensis TaxID=2590886 RepID=A0A9E4ZNN6_9EURY|nr:hypothetical protein [Methanoculleus sp. Afa-1]MCT8337765.1 hypothetical protein [Methanoculleus sp. Afa-1]
MNPFFVRILVLLCAVCIAVTTVQAAEVSLEDDRLVVTGVDDSLGLGAFDVILTYGNDVTVDSTEGLSGFMVAANVKNDEGVAIVAGISTEGMTGTVPVATVKRSGTGIVDVTVRMLANTRGDPIPFTDPEFSGNTPTPHPSVSSSPTETTLPTAAVTPTLTAEPVREQDPSGVPAATQTTTVSDSPMTSGVTEVVEVAESIPLDTPKAGLPSVIAAISLLAVMILKRKS